MNDVLSGYTIGITADRRSEEQIQMLGGRGARCIHGPVIETQPLLPEAEIAVATRQLIADPPDITILTTGIGVRGWFSSADSLLLGADLRMAIEGSEVFARGPKARGAAITAGIDVGPNSTSMALDQIIDELSTRDLRGIRIAIQLDGDPDIGVVNQLADLEAEIIAVPVYQWALPENLEPARDLVQAVAEHRVDALTFTARPAAQNFIEIATTMGLLDSVREAALETTAVFSVGEHTAAAVFDAGLGRGPFPEEPLLGNMILLLTKALTERTADFELGGCNVTLRGSELRVDQNPPALLTWRERRLLTALMSRPGVVFSKANLLSEVWRGSAEDEHVVEVTIARLRKRMGKAGTGIETVIRRGYRISAG